MLFRPLNMKKNEHFWIAVLFLFFSLGPLVSHTSAKTTAKSSRLNVLMITIDTLRPDRLSCYNSTYLKTPHIDSLAAKGSLFLKSFAHTPTTLPSHTNIHLGTTPLYHGVHDNQNFRVQDEFLTLAELLKENGYSTGAFVGAFPLDSRFGLTQGFDIYDDDYGTVRSEEFSYIERKAEVVIQKAQAWLTDREGPWFLWLHCFDPHQRYDPPEPFKTEYKDRPYDGEVAYVDAMLGRLFDFLQQENLYENTLIIFTGDHGESLGEHGETTHGYFAYNSTLWIPLIIYYPGIKPIKIDQYVCHTDIFPTVCDVLGIKKPSFLQGISLLPAMNGKKLSSRLIYFESLYPYYSRGWAPLKGYIQKQEKYLDTPIKELYDLEKDFYETENLAKTKNLNTHESILSNLIEDLTYETRGAVQTKTDRDTIERLRSLGYISSPQASLNKKFTAKDDLKELLPYQLQLQSAMKAYHKGDFTEAIDLLSGIITKRKDFDLAYTHLATLYKEQKNFKKAIEVLREGYQNCPSSYKVITTFGIFLTEISQYDAAISILKEGMAIIDYDPELWNYLGVAHWKKGDLEKAKEHFLQCLSLDNNYPIAFNNLGSVYLSQFIKTKERQSIEEAINLFKRAIELDPLYASAYNGLGAAYRNQGNLDGAIYCWEKAVELDTNFAYALYNLGMAYFVKGENIKAAEALTEYKEKNYHLLPADEQNNLDNLIKKIKKF